ncbi:MAG: type II toxin-antitoxin system VapC family toxin [Alphaproteobacteria bacterium]|nr:type II toxin-antitoxin system VapC family toxin [Alphaproteobacteria bacterium]MCB9928967.1 type II toxin-antitoxin system VapC family toxin [Alphaproteobacteria bacterium]
MSFVVDASIAAKWFFPEPGSDRAMRLLEIDRPLYAPDLIVPELTNLLWKRWQQDDLAEDYARQIAAALPLILRRLVAGVDLAEPAWQWSRRLAHPSYDCFYIACAQHVAGRMVTVDARLLAAVKGTEAGPLVCHLRDVVTA